MAKKKPTARAPLPPAKRRLFIAITIALPFLFLAAAELTLRLAGWGGYPPWTREVGRLPSGATLCRVEPAAAAPYSPAGSASPDDTDEAFFLMPKPAGTVRIFVIGESAARGTPQPRNLAVSSFLRAMLSDAWPGKTVEIINLGATGVASFPLVYQVRDALRFAPDLFIFYAGNNEFFGAYGAAAVRPGPLPPRLLPWIRAARGLALVQAAGPWLTRGASMPGPVFLPADSPLREAAARHLAAHLGTMLDEVRAAGVPAVVCTTASNESGLAPLGEDDVTGLDGPRQRELQRLLAEAAEAADRDDFARAVTLLREAVQLAPRHARARFLLGQVLARAGQPGLARVSFLEARDLDTLPWRPISLTEQAVRHTALVKGAILCDTAGIFRQESPDGASGWELLDDHVHLSLSGQALAARAMVGAMADLAGPLRLGPDELALVQDDKTYAAALGANRYDDYRVNRDLAGLFGGPVLEKTNAPAYDVFAELCRGAEEEMPPPVRAVARDWLALAPPVRAARPLAGLVADVLRREGRTEEALDLYIIAARQVPGYTPSYLEYVAAALACRREADGDLDEADLQLAAEAIAQGKFLLANGRSESGLTGLHVGRLHQLRAEWSEAIPFLLAARPKMRAEDLVATDQALFLSYWQTGQKEKALALADDGMKNGGPFADLYRRLREEAAK